MSEKFTAKNETWTNLGGCFRECGYDTIHEFALDVLPHMRHDVQENFEIVRWADGHPVVRSSFHNLSNTQDWACDMFGYSFSIFWNGQ